MNKNSLSIIYGFIAIIVLALIILAVIFSMKSERKGIINQLEQGGFILGNENAGVVLIEFGDYQCPACGMFYENIEKNLVEDYINTRKVRFVWRDIAFLGDESNWAAEAARCAFDQGKYWEYHRILFENQSGENRGAFSKDNLEEFAAELELNGDEFNQCLDSGKYTQLIKDETEKSFALGVRSTPTYFINSKQFVGVPKSYVQFKAEIDKLLK